MSSSRYIHEQGVRALHHAAVSAGIAGRRSALLLGIDASVTARLPVENPPSAQILSDLFQLAELTLPDGSLPILGWLRNALALVGLHASAMVFEEALRELGQAVPAREPEPGAAERTKRARAKSVGVRVQATNTGSGSIAQAVGPGGNAISAGASGVAAGRIKNSTVITGRGNSVRRSPRKR
jgi:hypothetical protein